MVNGQTGKVVGTAPISIIKVGIAILLVAALVLGGVLLWRTYHRPSVAPPPLPSPYSPYDPRPPEPIPPPTGK